MASVEQEIETLRKEHEDKVRQITEKRRQVEEMKRRRMERAARGRQSVTAPQSGGEAGAGSIDSLLSEVLSGGSAGRSQASGAGPLKDLAAHSRPAGRDVQLTMELSVASCLVEPVGADIYEKGCQTEDQGDGGGGSKPTLQTSVLQKMAERARQRAVKPDDATQDVRARRTFHPDRGTKHDGLVPDSIAEEAAAALEREEKENAKPVKELSADEKKTIMGNPEFKSFFDRASLLVERVLGQEEWDVAANFGAEDTAEAGGEGGEAGSERLKYIDDYIDEKWAPGRPLTDLQFSPKREELFLASYGQRASPSLSDPDGCALVWNLAMKNRPELAFSCQSAVLTAQFHRFNPALCFGGTYAGGVVLWDARAKASPVQRTPLSAKGHSHPVYAMQQVGTQNATNLVSASSDGRLCVWSLAMLVHPQESLDLKNETRNRRDLAVTTLTFPENETNILYVGAEDGSVCQVHIHGTRIGVTESFDGHEGPVAGLDMHPHGDGSIDNLGDLAVSCSFDWSIKVWSVKQFQSPVLSLDAFEDYVYDVRWHPTHPACFAAVDGEGHVDLWNLNRDLEGPAVRFDSAAKRALNKCHWSIDGKRLCTGDSEGVVSVYGVDKSVSQPTSQDNQHFQDRMRQFQPIASRSRDSSSFNLDSRYGLSSRS